MRHTEQGNRLLTMNGFDRDLIKVGEFRTARESNGADATLEEAKPALEERFRDDVDADIRSQATWALTQL